MASPTQRDETSGLVNSEQEVFMVEPLNSAPPYGFQLMTDIPMMSRQYVHNISYMTTRRFLSPQPLNSAPYANQRVIVLGLPAHQPPNSVPPIPSLRPPSPHNLLQVTESGAVMNGNAIVGQIGPQVGKVDVSQYIDSYSFRVSLPGISQQNFRCTIKDDGQVTIEGVTSNGNRLVRRDCNVYVMRTRNLCPPEHFSISFRLPGPVDDQIFTGSFRTDGILVATVKKIFEFGR